MPDIIQVRINGKLVGVVGLGKIMEDMAVSFADQEELEIKKEILKRAGQYNYIPRSAEEAYGLALVREFRRFLGQESEEPQASELRITVLGPGCARCTQLERNVREALTELRLPGELIHMDDLREIARSGVMGTPALIVNGKIVSVGTTPGKEEIKKWLQTAATSL